MTLKCIRQLLICIVKIWSIIPIICDPARLRNLVPLNGLSSSRKISAEKREYVYINAIIFGPQSIEEKISVLKEHCAAIRGNDKEKGFR